MEGTAAPGAPKEIIKLQSDDRTVVDMGCLASAALFYQRANACTTRFCRIRIANDRVVIFNQHHLQQDKEYFALRHIPRIL
jgi:hypothetical protein